MFSVIFPLIIFLLSFISALFLLKFPALQPSVEPTVWVQAKFIVENFPNLSWFGNWYAGFPFRFSGPPILVYFLAFLDKISGIQIPTLEGIILALSLAILPVGIYFLARFLIKNQLLSFLVALLFSILPSIGYIFPQAGQIGTSLNFLPWRIVGFLTFGGGSKLIGFAILPFLILLFWQAINNFSRKKFVLSVILTTILLLTDFGVFVSFLIFGVALISAEGFKTEWIEKAKRGVLIILTSAGLSAFWYTPGYLLNILASPSLAGLSFGQILQRLFQFTLVAIPTFFAVFGFFSKKLSKEAIFVVLSLGFFGSLTLLWWATDPDFLTLYSRFFTEIDLVVGFATGLFFGWLFKKIQKNWTQNLLEQKIGTNLGSVLLIMLIIFGFWVRFDKTHFPKFDIDNSLEKEIATWLQEHTLPTDRVYLSGSTAFWLNYFAPNVSQVRGGVDQAATHPFWAHASFNLREGEDSETALAWLKALRVKYVVVHDRNSREFYHDFKNPEKFKTIGEKVFDNSRGDKIFQIKTPGLAQIVDEEILSLKKPKDGADLTAIDNYVNFLEQGRKAEVDWIGPKKLKVQVDDLKVGEGISLGVTYDPAWKVQLAISYKPLAIKKDPIGNLFLVPKSEMQNVEIELGHGARWNNWIGYSISVLTLFLILKPKIAARILKRLPKLHFGLSEEES